MASADTSKASRRREPPPLRTVRVTDRLELSPRLLRLSFEGDGLGLMDVPEPAGSVRLLAPNPGEELVIPKWAGNEYLLPNGDRSVLRTFTPLRFDPGAQSLDLEIVRHPGGAVSTWAETAAVGDEAAISGPSRGITIDPGIERYVVCGDETALPAVTQLLDVLPTAATLDVHVELTAAHAQVELPSHPGATITWHVNSGDAPGATLIDTVCGLGDLTATDHVWAAGEAASMQAIRKHVFNERGLPRSAATVRGYWKPPR